MTEEAEVLIRLAGFEIRATTFASYAVAKPRRSIHFVPFSCTTVEEWQAHLVAIQNAYDAEPAERGAEPWGGRTA